MEKSRLKETRKYVAIYSRSGRIVPFTAPSDADSAIDRRAVAFKPVDILSLCQLADELVEESPEAARQIYLHVQSLGWSRRALFGEAKAFARMECSEEWIARAREVIRHEPGRADGWFLLGAAFVHQGKHEAAVPVLRRGLEIEKDPPTLELLRFAQARSRSEKGMVMETLE
jgi:cytochrome c-type biogenesis protein CcmH/NrfG